MPEASRGGPTATQQLNTAPFGTLVFLASDVMLFVRFFAAYYFLRGQASEWRPSDVSLSLPVPIMATAVLVASSVTMQLAVRAFETGRTHLTQRWLAMTVLLGGVFLVNQVRHSQVSASRSRRTRTGRHIGPSSDFTGSTSCPACS